ncbi:interleukin-22 [Macrotis lagotis]|uniref:interleukin-22 n=1 Tax=Macrotis lagotis TaxID=92651 RepID=UPI003D6836DF
METEQGLENFSRKTLTLLLLMTLLIQGEGASLKAFCRVEKGIFKQLLISRQIILLAKNASLLDNDTNTRFIDHSLFNNVQEADHCFVMREVLNLQLKEVLIPSRDKYQPYMHDVLSFLKDLKTRLNHCTMNSDETVVQKKVDSMKHKIKEMGKDGEVKVISELDLLLYYLRKSCS